MELYLKESWSRIGISVSGGADSALLAYLICKNVSTTTEIHITSQIRCWRTRPWQEHFADGVIDWLKQKFNNKFYVHKNLVPPEMEEPNTTLIKDEYGKMKPGNRIILRSYNEFIANKYKLDALYAGVNMNPDIDIPGKVAERDEGHIAPHFVHNEVDICHPFVYTKKDWIIQQYYENNIVDLLNLTRSCEGEFEGLNYTTYTPGQHVPVCRECFWCKEREWAIEQAK
jgi:7-cyano-7-deazaguanine synthase in queuosine biosynthesis